MFLQIVTKYSRVIALLGICAVIAALSPNFLTVSNLVGGIARWSAEGLPVRRSR